MRELRILLAQRFPMSPIGLIQIKAPTGISRSDCSKDDAIILVRDLLLA
jgi:hypothetical protein